MIERLIHFLGTELNFNAQEVADLLWLTLEQQKRVQKVEITEPSERLEDSTTVIDDKQLSTPLPNLAPSPPPRKSSQVDIYAPSPSQSSTPTLQGYTPLPVPDARALNHPLDLLKALKPLSVPIPSATEKIIDESATAQWIAQTQLWQIITEPDSELWLELVLIVDESVSMMLWRRTVTELQQFFQHYGLFRDVQVWGMGLDAQKNLYFGSTLRPHQPKELIDVQGRRLILLVSDFVDNLWYQEPILTIIEEWTQYNPVAALQMLPEWLWSRSAFAVHTPAILRNTKANIINRNLEASVNRLQKRRGLDRGIKLPVFNLEVEPTKRWSKMLVGMGEQGAIGYVLRQDLLEHRIISPSDSTATERVANFSANASPLAHKLAGLLAAAPVITMPVVRLIQDSMLPESGQIQVAEVFLGGLLKLKQSRDITPETDPELVHYDFIEGVRVELIKVVPIPERDEVLDRVSRYVARGLGISLREFIAWIKNPNSVEQTQEVVEGLVKPFARVTREILGQLGEDLPSKENGELIGDIPGFNFKLLTVTVKTLEAVSVSQPSTNLETLKFETVFVNDRGEIIETKQCQANYYLEPLSDSDKSSWFSKAVSFLRSASTVEPLTMIYIPEGELIMGSHSDEKGRYDGERPLHRVKIAPFFISQTPITQAQWRFVANLPQIEQELKPNPSMFKGDNNPVDRVNWYDAIEFCARLSRYTGREYRLPSEAQWEYACRGFVTPPVSLPDSNDTEKEHIINTRVYPPFHFGETITDQLANYYATSTYANEPQGKSRSQTTPVRTFKPNAFGLYDLHGNVREWCLDPWHDNYNDAPRDGRVWDEENTQEDYYQDIVNNIKNILTNKRNRVLRGGSFNYTPRFCRSAYRFNYYPRVDTSDYGLRVVCGVSRT